MGVWQLFKELAKGTRFYKRQFVFFCLLFAIGISTVILVGNQVYRADTVLFKEGSQLLFEESRTINLTVTGDGRVLKDGKLASSIELGEQQDTLRYNIVNRPGTIIDSLRVVVKFERSLPYGDVEHYPIATHYDMDFSSNVKSSLQGNNSIVYTGQLLGPDTIFTLYARFPKGVINPPWWRWTAFEIAHLPPSAWFNLSLALPLLTAIALGVMIIRRWLSYGSTTRMMLNEPPEDLPSAIVGVLMRGRIGAREIAATILDLARRGYLHIYQNGSSFSFGRGQALESDAVYRLYPFEKYLLTKIFTPEAAKASQAEIDMRLGRRLFSRKIAQVFLEIYNEVAKHRFFRENPGAVHQKYKIVGLALLLLSLGGFSLNAIYNKNAPYLLLFWVGMMLASVLIIYLAPYMPVLTREGRSARRDWLAFRRYLTKYNNVSYQEEVQDYFSIYLPYAIVLTTETVWTSHFVKLPFSLPTWFDSNQQIASIEDFANNLFPLITFLSRDLIASRTPVID